MNVSLCCKARGIFRLLRPLLLEHMNGIFALLLLTLSAFSAQAQWSYQTQDGTVIITGYTGPGGSISVPSTIEGLPVTTIGDNAFWADNNLTSITLPEGITTIGSHTFFLCGNLVSVTL